MLKYLFAALEKRGRHCTRDTALLRVLEHGLRASEVTALNIKDYDGKRLHIVEAKRDIEIERCHIFFSCRTPGGFE